MSLADPDVAERFVQWRHKVNNDGTSLVDVCAAEELRLSMGDIYYFAHWIRMFTATA